MNDYLIYRRGNPGHMSSDSALQLPPAYLPSLTGIRALAAMLVLGYHSVYTIVGSIPAPVTFISRGYLGVDFFFLLSGFIITHVYLAHLAGPSRSNVKVFFWHRLIRLYPVHLMVLVWLVASVWVVTTMLRPVHTEEIWRFRDVIWHLLLLHAWGFVKAPSWNLPSWSISAEWFAYLLFPLIAPMLNNIRTVTIAFGLAILALLVTVAAFIIQEWGVSSSIVGVPALVRVSGEFICGAALCRTVQLAQNSFSSKQAEFLGGGAFVFFILGASIGAPDFFLIGLLAMTIVGASTAKGYFAAALKSVLMVWLGEISYSLYMTHFLVLSVIDHPAIGLHIRSWSMPARIVALVITLAACLATAAVMFYVVERPSRIYLRNRAGFLVAA
jgi:peptidoglycan/LPS O-acetylase OafA/YrhL